MEFWAEVKPSKTQDAFAHKEDFSAKTFEKNKGESAKTRGQLISYAAAVMSRQHRTHLFSLLICDHYLRLSRWDRTGSTVSELVDLHKRPEVLGYFLKCYSLLSPAERGFDTSVKLPTRKEESLLRDALKQYEAQCKEENRNNVTALKEPKKEEYPWPAFKIQVDFNGTMRSFVVGRPFWGADSPCGRSTRGYVAYDLTQKKLVFLKDSWRTEDDYITAEGIIYAEMEDNGVPFLPQVLAAGDVMTGGTVQRTVSQDYANSASPPKWMLPCAKLRTYVHYRVVQELAYPLASAKSSREAVQAIRDAIEGL